MKSLNKYSRAAAYLSHIFDLLNDRYFESALSKPVITIQSTPHAFGHFTLFDAWSVDGRGAREINIGAGTLSRPIENVVATLLHEMCHYHNDSNGVKDTSRGNTYHNRKFKELAEKCDLQIDHHPTYGWSITSPTDELVKFCLDNSLTEIRLCRNDGFTVGIPGTGTHSGTNAGAGKKKPGSTRKYICPCCGMSVRATKAVNVGCLDCSEKLVPAA